MSLSQALNQFAQNLGRYLRIGAASFFKTTFWKIDRLFLFRSWVEENRTDTTIIIRSKNDS